MRELLATTAMVLMLGVCVLPAAHAQETGTSGSQGGSSGGAAGSAAGGASGSDTGGDKGGTTGAMTTTPEAKSDDAAGTSESVATPGGAETPTDGPNQGCTAAQRYDAATNTCVPM